MKLIKSEYSSFETRVTQTSKKNILLDIVLIVLVTLGLIAFNYLLILFQIEGSDAFDRSVFPDQFVVAPIVACIASVIALVKNRRMVLTISAYFCLAISFLWLRSIESSEVLLQTYTLVRNTSYFYLLIYIILHFTIIGILRFKNPERNLINPVGLVNWWLLFIIANYLHALVGIGR